MLELKDILRIGMQAAQGLAAAHAQGLVHRDVKPANILLEKTVDRVLLTDFGLARAIDDAALTRSGVIAGTPQYMSPEQARGDAVDHRTDLFSLGSVLYAMSTGRPPFRAETTMGILRRICDTEPRDLRETNADVPPWLAGIIDKLLTKDPDQRFQSAGQLGELLEKCLAHVQHPRSVDLPAELQRREVKRHRTPRRWPLALAAIPLTALVPVMGWLLFAYIKQPTNQPPAQTTPQSLAPAATANVPTSADGSWPDDLGRQLFEIDNDLQQLEWQTNVESAIHDSQPEVGQSETPETEAPETEAVKQE